MQPDNIHHQPPGQDSLPQVQHHGAVIQHAAPAELPHPAGQQGDTTAVAVEQLKSLLRQYGANPFTFQAAFQQLKMQYLRDQYQIDLSADKK